MKTIKDQFHAEIKKHGIAPSPRMDAFLDFIKTGSIKSGTTESEIRAHLDFSRSMILDLSGKVRSLTKLNDDAMKAVRAAQALVNRATAAPAAAHARSAAAAPPAPAPAPAGTTTAAAMLAAIAKPKMTVAEFNKFPHGQRGEIIKKIQLID